MDFSSLPSLLTWVAFFIGAAFIVAGIVTQIILIIGAFRFSGKYTFLHVSSTNDMLSVPLVLLGVSFLFLAKEDYANACKTIALVAMIYIVSPIGSYLMAKLLHIAKSDPEIQSKAQTKAHDKAHDKS